MNRYVALDVETTGFSPRNGDSEPVPAGRIMQTDAYAPGV